MVAETIQSDTPFPNGALSQERLRVLYQLIEQMNSVYELPELLAFILDRVLEHTGGLRGYLLLTQPADADDGPFLKVEAIRGQELEQVRTEDDVLCFVSSSVVYDVLKQGEPRVIEDLRHDERYAESAGMMSSIFKWRSILAIPLTMAERRIGLMYVEHPGRNAFPNPDMDLLSAFAAQAAVAIDRARQSHRRVEELERLSQVSQSVVRVLDLDQVLIRILHEATRLLDVETGSVLLLDAEAGELAFRVSVRGGRSVSIPHRLKVGQGIGGWVAQHGQPLLLSEVRQDPRWYGEVEDDFQSRSVLCVPLKADGHIIGVLQVLNKQGLTGFTERDLTLLSAFAASATIAIENARLFAEASQARELRALNEVAAALTASLDLERVLQVIMAEVNALIGVERASIFLIDENSGDLVLEYSLGGKEAIRLPAPWPGIAGWIAREGLPIIVNDVRSDPRWAHDIDAATQFDTRSILGAPLKLDERVIGVIEMLNKRSGPFTEHDRELLVDFSKWAAIALNNAQLYRELDKTKERLASAEAIAVMSDMALNLTHRLNNRVSVARVNAARIQAKCQSELDNPYLAQKVEQIRLVTAESLDIIRRIRQPFELTELELVDVSDCLAEALSSFHIEPGIQVLESYQPRLPQVLASREKVVETCCHIIGNALDAMARREKGVLRLQTRYCPDGLVEAVVADDGAGIPLDVQAHVFEPFFTTKESERRGLGLGLWLTRMYISRLGGQVKLDSTPGQGTTVSLRLPAAQEKSP
ncbi:MAG: GAF domain-containing protein [Thermoflexales bacterium]|nr:GAF domain-containing protein [Thermoflexales bacterium]